MGNNASSKSPPSARDSAVQEPIRFLSPESDALASTSAKSMSFFTPNAILPYEGCSSELSPSPRAPSSAHYLPIADLPWYPLTDAHCLLLFCKGSFSLPLKDFSDTVLFYLLDHLDNGALMLWLAGDKELQGRLERAPRLRALLPFGVWQFPLTLLSKFANPQKVELGFPECHFHGIFREPLLPETWTSIVNLTIYSPSLMKYMDPNLASLFPNCLHLTFTTIMLPEIYSRPWTMPPSLETFSIKSRSLIERCHLDIRDCNWLSILPDTVHTIKADVILSLKGDSRDLGVRWPSRLTHLELHWINFPPSYAIDLSNSIIRALTPRRAGRSSPRAVSPLSSSPSTVASPRSSGKDEIMVTIAPSTVQPLTTFLDLPGTVETIICAIPFTPPPASMPQNIRIFRNLTNDANPFMTEKTVDEWFDAFPGLLQEMQIGQGFSQSMPVLSHTLLKSGRFTNLSGLTVRIDLNFKVEDLLVLPSTVRRLTLLGNLPSKKAFHLPPCLTFLRINLDNTKTEPLPILPITLERLVVVRSGTFSPYFTFPLHLRTLVSHSLIFTEEHSLELLPASLTSLHVHLSVALLALERFNPRFLPPLLRELSLTLHGDKDQHVDWVKWWAHVPANLPLEVLSITNNESLPALVSFNSHLTFPNATPPIGSPPLSATESAELGIPRLHPSITRLSVKLKGLCAGLAENLACNLPRGLVSLQLFAEDTKSNQRILLPMELLVEGPKTLRQVRTNCWTEIELVGWKDIVLAGENGTIADTRTWNWEVDIN